MSSDRRLGRGVFVGYFGSSITTIGSSVPAIRTIAIGRWRANSDFNSNFAPIDFLVCECLESLLLLLLRTDVDEAVAFAATGAAIATAYNTSRNDVNVSRSENISEGNIVDIESEIGDEKD
jgi:hypothetical protein